MRHSLARLSGALFACALLTSACDGPEDLDGTITSLVVRGTVEEDTGVPVSGAVVDVSWKPGFCDDDLEPLPPDTTAADGEFAVSASSWGTHLEACVRVRAAPPAASALQEARVEVGGLRLHPQDGPDTLTLRLTLRAP